jgi:hypothetical protein
MSKRLQFLLLAALIELARGQNPANVEFPLAGFSAALLNGTLTVGTDCSERTPCNVRYGNVVYSFKTAATIRTSGSTSGLVFIYIDPSGNLAAGSTVKLICQACNYAPGVTQFPPDSTPLFTWPIVGGTFAAAGHSDFRAIFSSKKLVPGSGMLMVENTGTTTLALDAALVPMHVFPPPKASHDDCSLGQFSFDNDYYYLCVSTNIWKRFALSTF